MPTVTVQGGEETPSMVTLKVGAVPPMAKSRVAGVMVHWPPAEVSQVTSSAAAPPADQAKAAAFEAAAAVPVRAKASWPTDTPVPANTVRGGQATPVTWVAAVT